MLTRLIEHWWVFLVRGIAGVLFGLGALLWPGITIFVLVAFYGAYALLHGISALVAAVSRGRQHQRWGLLALEGVLGIGAGIVTFIWPDITAFALLMIIAVWALWTGILEIVAGIRIRREVEGEWMLYLSGASSVLFGILLLISPSTGAVALAWLIGIYALIFGVLFIILAYRLRRMKEQPTRPATAPAV